MTGGRAVFARDVIEQGELIAIWSGRIVGADELDELPSEIRRHTVQVEEALYLASITEAEPPDFINHSCEPNAGLEGQIAIVALQRIQPGDEVTIDYAMCDGSPYDEFECGCGSAICRGRVTGDDWRNPMLVGALRRAFLALSRAPHQGSQAAALPPQAGACGRWHGGHRKHCMSGFEFQPHQGTQLC